MNEWISPHQSPAAKMTPERILGASKTLKKYKAGKARLEARLIADEMWWKGHAWDTMREQGNPGAAKRSTKWLVSVIMGKHSDMMDAYPEPVILPREQGDEEEARRLTSILPVVLEQNQFEEVYSKQAWEKNKHGTGVYAIYWDSGKWNGLGDVTVTGIDLANLFWEPGVEDIQQSRNVFLVSPLDRETLVQRYPQLQNANLQSDFTLPQYRTEDAPGKAGKALVVDWYYHTYEGGRKILQYCKFVGDTVLYASEDDPNLRETGWYADGEYPFVLDVLFPQKESPAGWGYIDLGRDTQEEIDLLNQAVTINAQAGAIPRYFRRRDSAINLEQFLDFTNPVIEVEGGLSDTDMVPVQHSPLDGAYVQHLNNKIEELKQTCGNHDVSNGITSGVTAASGIAAQMEAAGRTSRDGNRGTYRAYSKVLEKVIERIRQFYDVPRTFRILGENAAYEFVRYDNSGLVLQPNPPLAGLDMGWRKPVFDIQVSAQKQNAYSKMAQNELALQLLGAGVFNPQLSEQSAMLLSMMDFSKKDELLRNIQQQAFARQMLAMWQNMALELAQRYEPDTAERMAMAVMNAAGETLTGREPGKELPDLTEVADPGNTRPMQRAREFARDVSQPE